MVDLAVLAVAITLLYKVHADDCPELFRRYSANHSYCRPKNQTCDIQAYYVTKDVIEEIVDLHNSYRSNVATGQSGQPPASNMLEIEWDDELAVVAQKYANLCLYKHDCSNCRRVPNFGVGQNLAMQIVSGTNIDPPQPDWKFAVNMWFSEIVYFQPSNVCPFNPPQQDEYRHFSQLVWAKTFRVGCGYTLFQTSNSDIERSYTRLYVCNYGPNGNVYEACVYKKGQPCSQCPENSCCGSSCGSQKKYNGLCKLKKNEAPKYPAPKPNLFYCNFQKDPDCDNYMVGKPNWVIEKTLSGNYLGIVLNGGENSTIRFKKLFKPLSSVYCITLLYRKGPNIHKTQDKGTALLIAYAPAINYMADQPLISYPESSRQQFSTFNFTVSWNYETQVQLSFSVPTGESAHFFNVRSILVTDGKCQSS